MKIKQTKTPEAWLETVTTISEALPYLQQFSGETFVIKYGGAAMGDGALARGFAEDVVLLKQVGIHPIVVHGGGPQIGAMLERLGIHTSFVEGLRVTDAQAVEVVEMVLAGSINKQIVSEINRAGGLAAGICGKDGHLIEARKLRRSVRDPNSNIERILDLGFVGEPVRINPALLQAFIDSHIIPVIAPIGVGSGGETFNINADTVAGALAASLGAAKLMMLTDVRGVMDKDGTLISELSIREARRLIKEGTISGGMIPKIETCLHALEHDTEAVHIIDGRLPHALLLEVFTHYGAGTMMYRESTIR